jgi:hypothetical protein
VPLVILRRSLLVALQHAQDGIPGRVLVVGMDAVTAK